MSADVGGRGVGNNDRNESEAGKSPSHSGAARDVVPSSWLAPAIVATLCCLSPTGVVAVYFAAQVSTRWGSGDRRGAARCARMARTWVLVSLVLWAVTLAILVATGRAGRFLEAGVL